MSTVRPAEPTSKSQPRYLFYLDDRLWIAAAVALHKLLDESLKQLRQPVGVVRAIHDASACGLVVVDLCAQLTAKVLERI